MRDHQCSVWCYWFFYFFAGILPPFFNIESLMKAVNKMKTDSEHSRRKSALRTQPVTVTCSSCVYRTNDTFVFLSQMCLKTLQKFTSFLAILYQNNKVKNDLHWGIWFLHNEFVSQLLCSPPISVEFQIMYQNK